MLLNKGLNFALPGNFEFNRLEGEYEIYRQIVERC